MIRVVFLSAGVIGSIVLVAGVLLAFMHDSVLDPGERGSPLKADGDVERRRNALRSIAGRGKEGAVSEADCASAGSLSTPERR